MKKLDNERRKLESKRKIVEKDKERDEKIN